MADPETEADAILGYHKAVIARGVFGEDSKIYEEIDEFADALDQNVQIMALVELSDVVGAIEGWLGKYHPTVTLADLAAMAAVTRRAFESGSRESRDG